MKNINVIRTNTLVKLKSDMILEKKSRLFLFKNSIILLGFNKYKIKKGIELILINSISPFRNMKKTKNITWIFNLNDNNLNNDLIILFFWYSC